MFFGWNPFTKKLDMGGITATHSDGWANRELDVTYQNTSGKVRMISVLIEMENQEQGANEATIRAYSYEDTPPIVIVAENNEFIPGDGVILRSIFFVVPNNYYYYVNFIGEPEVILATLGWIEWDLG